MRDYSTLPLGTVICSHWGNRWRRFNDGWSPLEGAHWDRWTVYSDSEMSRNHPYTELEIRG